MGPILRFAEMHIRRGTAMRSSNPGRPAPVALPTRSYVFLWSLAGLAVLLAVTMEWRQPLSAAQWGQVGIFLTLGLVAHAGEFEISRRGNSEVFLSAGFAVSVIALIELPPVGAMIAVAFGSMTLNQITHSARPAATVVLNRSALALCALAGAVVYQVAHDLLPHWEILRLAGSTLLASLVYASLSLGLVGAYVGVRAGYSLRRPWDWPLDGSLTVYRNYLALGLLGDLILTMYRIGEILGLALALIPLIITYFSMKQSADMGRLYDSIVSTLVDSLDLRDRDTGGHTRRVAALAVRLGHKLGLRGQDLDDLHTAALLHDLGKIGVADSILLKPSRLTEEEWLQMRRHPELGADLLRAHGLLHGAVPMILHHQESFDGSGYPAGLSGERIPLGARIITVADAFMAMVDGRPYRKPRGGHEAHAELQRCAGTQFDPQVVAALQPADWEVIFRETPAALDANRV